MKLINGANYSHLKKMGLNSIQMGLNSIQFCNINPAIKPAINIKIKMSDNEVSFGVQNQSLLTINTSTDEQSGSVGHMNTVPGEQSLYMAEGPSYSSSNDDASQVMDSSGIKKAQQIQDFIDDMRKDLGPLIDWFINIKQKNEVLQVSFQESQINSTLDNTFIIYSNHSASTDLGFATFCDRNNLNMPSQLANNINELAAQNNPELLNRPSQEPQVSNQRNQQSCDSIGGNSSPISNVNGENSNNSNANNSKLKKLSPKGIEEEKKSEKQKLFYRWEVEMKIKQQTQSQYKKFGNIFDSNVEKPDIKALNQQQKEKYFLHQMYGTQEDTKQDELKYAIQFLYIKSKEYKKISLVKQAVMCMEKCQQLQRYIKVKDIQLYRQIIFGLAQALLLQGNYRKAFQIIKKVYYIYSQQKNKKKQLQTIILWGKCSAEQYEDDSAIKLLEQARNIIDNQYHFNNEANLKKIMIGFSILCQQSDEQIKLKIKQLNKGYQQNDQQKKAKQLYLQILETMGLVYAYKSQIQKATQHYIDLILLLPYESDVFKKINFSKLGNDYQRYCQKRFDWKTSLELVEQYLPNFLALKGGITSESILINKQIGTLYSELGYFQKSYNKFKETLKIMQEKQIQNISHKIIILQWLGGLQFNYQFNYTAALDTFLDKLKLIRQSEDRYTADWIETLNRIGLVFIEIQQPKKAQESFECCLKAIDELKKYYSTYLSTLKIYVLINRIENQKRFNESQQASQFFNLILSILKETQSSVEERQNKQGKQFHRLSGQFYTSISTAYQRKGDFQNSLNYAIKALNNYQKSIHDYRFLKICFTNIRIAYLLQKSKKYLESLKKYQEVLSGLAKRKGSNTLIVAQIQNQIGNVCLELGSYEKAIEHFKKQMKIRKKYSTQERTELTPLVYEDKYLETYRDCFKHVYQGFQKSQDILGSLIEKNQEIYCENIDFIEERQSYVEKMKQEKRFQKLFG